jgi:hypothetical protein
MKNRAILESMLEEFDGCEGDDPGTTESPSIWLFGIEPGRSISDQNNASTVTSRINDGYRIDIQRKWPYNRNAFKLLAAIKGYSVSQYLEFANLYQPFVVGGKGYFKGNLFPYACKKVGDWPDDAIIETGLKDKSEYQEWCRVNRWPIISKWVDQYRPLVFIGVGNSCRNDFALSVFGREVELNLHEFMINRNVKRIYYKFADGRRLVVIPHLSRGLHENASLQYAGEFIADLIRAESTLPGLPLV